MSEIIQSCIRATVVSCAILISDPVATATEYAPVMPLAAHSLLLDVTDARGRAVTVGERGHILFSDDNGANWQQARIPTAQMLTGVDFIDGQRGWAVGHDGLILVSDDGGESWRVQRDGLAAQRQANLEFREYAHREVARLEASLASTSGNDLPKLEMLLEEARMDLEDADLALDEEVFTSPLLDVWFLDQDRGWAIGAFGTLLATRNGGQTWVSNSALVDNPDEFHLNAITGDASGRVFIAGEGGVMFRSLDGGDSWETLETFYEGSWFGALYSEAREVLLVFGLRGNLYRSTDFGESWVAVHSDNSVSLAGGSAAGSGDIVLVGGVGTLLHSVDGGLSFQRTMLPDRLGLSAALHSGSGLILVGQGGVKTRSSGGAHE